MKATLAILLALALAGCTADERAVTGTPGTPVILISIDTLRSDHLPAYGYENGSTPAIDAFRRDAVLFERAYTHTPLTLPSHASMLTGVLPADHGVRDNVGYQLAEDVPTLPQILKNEGYATGAAVSAFVLRTESGLDRGFDFYDDRVEAIGPTAVIGRVQRGGDETAKIALDWIRQHAAQPHFFFLHLYDPHTPYEPPEPYASRFAHPYDGEIAFADSIVGSFLDELKRLGIYDRALIILLSDHGEGLNDHREEEHGIFLYREAIQVPLIVKFPGGAHAGASVGAPAQIVDVFPTILAQTGIGGDDDTPGRPLGELLADPGEPRLVYSETYYPRLHFGWSDLHSLTDGEMHYIHAPRPELYDLRADPAERQNVLEENRRTYFAMREAIEPLVRLADAPAAVAPEEAAKLAALGYLGSTVQTEPGEALADPKDTIEVFHQIRVAFTAYRDAEYARALEMIDALLADNRRMVDLWDLRSKVLTRLGRQAEAVAAAKEGLKLAPHASHLALTVANLALEAGDLEDAERHADLALEGEPSQAREILARIALERKDLALAGRYAREALEHDPQNLTAMMTVARVERDEGKLEAALARLDEVGRLLAQRENRSITNFHFLRGDVLARMGRAREAEREFREEIRLFPEGAQPYKNLIFLLAVEGRTREAAALINDLVESAPVPPSYVAVCEVLELLGDERSKRRWAREGLEKFPDHPGLRKLAAS